MAARPRGGREHHQAAPTGCRSGKERQLRSKDPRAKHEGEIGGQTLRSKSGTAIEFVSAMPTTEQGFKRALATLNPQGCVTNPYALSLSPTYSEPQAENRGHIWRYIKGKGGFHPSGTTAKPKRSSD